MEQEIKDQLIKSLEFVVSNLKTGGEPIHWLGRDIKEYEYWGIYDNLSVYKKDDYILQIIIASNKKIMIGEDI